MVVFSGSIPDVFTIPNLPTSFDEFDAGQGSRKTFFDVLERAKFLNSLTEESN